MWAGFGKIFENVAAAILGSIASGTIAQGLNMAFAPRPPSRGDVRRDLQMQAEATAGAARPIRTPEQERADRLTVEQGEARQATFRDLSREYAAVQAAGSSPVWDPYEETNIRREAMAEAAVRGMGESGQAQDWVARRLDEARLRRSQEANRLHEQKLSNLREQMVPYTNVQRPGDFAMSPAPQAAPLPRSVQQPFSASPVDIVSMLRPRRPNEEDEPKFNATEDRGILYGPSHPGRGGVV